jgi:hypothetical protein
LPVILSLSVHFGTLYRVEPFRMNMPPFTDSIASL